ncbi:MAG: alpha/beta hydrolase [Streptomycetaceae bacterium]|jgi:pimeloyl-ACP methyl ester carboxylesterase|nr:MAG: alpha/beta hydrolase [Streptomycetaceae bacterium]
MSSSLKLSDGRALDYTDNGVSSKSALILHHGTPTSMAVWGTWLAAIAEVGIRAIAFTRPGYAGSDRKVDHTVISANNDLEEILNHLEVENFVSIGWSGGGPYALASGLLERCSGVQLIASVSPYDAEDFDWFQDQSPESIEEAKISVASLADSIAFKQGYYAEIRDRKAEEFLVEYAKRASFSSFENVYRAFAEDLSLSLRDALRVGVIGYAEDEYAFLRNWGFEVKDVRVPVVIWQGLDDLSVSPHMARWFNENLCNPTLELLEGQHHGSIMVEKRAEILNAAIRSLTL